MLKNLDFAQLVAVACAALPAKSMADEGSPYAWTERCLASAEGKLDLAGKTQDCIAMITTYCRFSTDSHSCYDDLAKGFSHRSSAIIDALPQSVDALPPQKQFYEKRLALVKETGFASRCETPNLETECAALVSFGRYLGAVSLAGWVEQREESE